MRRVALIGGVLGGVSAVLAVSWLGATSAATEPYQSSAMASWVQAIGSIAAIIGAVWIGERQAKRAREHALETNTAERRRRCEAYAAVASHAVTQLTSVKPFVAKNRVLTTLLFQVNFNKRNSQDTLEAMRLVPLHELGSREAVDGFLQVRQALAWALENVDKWMSEPRPDFDFCSTMRYAIERAEAGYSRLQSGLLMSDGIAQN